LKSENKKKKEKTSPCALLGQIWSLAQETQPRAAHLDCAGRALHQNYPTGGAHRAATLRAPCLALTPTGGPNFPNRVHIRARGGALTEWALVLAPLQLYHARWIAWCLRLMGPDRQDLLFPLTRTLLELNAELVQQPLCHLPNFVRKLDHGAIRTGLSRPLRPAFFPFCYAYT
jgi:hypothetical protein